MNHCFKKLLVVGASVIPFSVNAMEVNGKNLEIYSKIHMSVDYSNRSDPAIVNDGMSVSSNSSRVGFKGKSILKDGKKIIWQAEQEVSFDDHNKGNFANRNSYIGLADGNNSIRVGVHDTPFKTVASKWGVFGDSVAERRSILGASYNKGNQLNERVTNMVMYQFKNKLSKLQIMYAVDPEATATGAVDDNNAKMIGVGIWQKLGHLKLSVGLEKWKKHSIIDNGQAMRLAAIYKMDKHQLGAIYEDVNSDGTTVNALAFKRVVVGINWKWQFASSTDFRFQYLVASDAEGASNTGASKLGIGVYSKLDKTSKVYVAFASTDNEVNAKFQAVDGGHGDEVKTITSGSPTSLSVGIEYKF